MSNTSDNTGTAALDQWREEVAEGDTLLGFTDWLAWQEADTE